MVKTGPEEKAEVLAAFRGARTVFQPIVDLHAWRISGFEALARFADGAPPPVWLARADAVGAREQMEIVLIESAIRAAEVLPAGLSVAYNASGGTMLRPELHALFTGHDRPWGLELEERRTTANLRKVRATVTRLGGTLYVDDAGAASADETRVATLRPDVVKIDRDLFWRIIEANEQPLMLLGGLFATARATGAKVLVEGVSDAPRLDLARALGADYAQGYYVGVPTPPEEIPALLAELHRRIGVDAPGL
ncbi:EAL domain-containing protein [Microbacterium sp. NPDC057659]|uniref:EAL domain-containing protein n=1 Tax=Microbacterium sp. NPDC057659 TaxID=3346198 RepID=UPI00366B77E3